MGRRLPAGVFAGAGAAGLRGQMEAHYRRLQLDVYVPGLDLIAAGIGLEIKRLGDGPQGFDSSLQFGARGGVKWRQIGGDSAGKLPRLQVARVAPQFVNYVAVTHMDLERRVAVFLGGLPFIADEKIIGPPLSLGLSEAKPSCCSLEGRDLVGGDQAQLGKQCGELGLVHDRGGGRKDGRGIVGA